MSAPNLSPKEGKVASPRRVMLAGSLIGIAAIASAAIGLSSRAKGVQELRQWTDEQAIPSVTLLTPVPGSSEHDLVLPGTIEAFSTGSIYARASGYISEWHRDIGAHVKKGETLATIDSPDLDQQLAQARADLLTAQANEKLAQLTADRWEQLAVRDVVSQQSKDEKVGDLQAKTAVVQSAQANVARLEALASFKNLQAPFDGIVTARSVDVGDLVNAGGTTGRALFQVSDLHIVRIYVRVPQAFLGDVRPGITASLSLPQYPDEIFQATLVTTSNALAQESRSALVELQAENSQGRLWPGSFAEVHFHLRTNPNVLRIPATALFFGPRGMEVATLGRDGKVSLSRVEIGRNLGNDVEVLSGLSLHAAVIDNPPEFLSDGQAVRVLGRGSPESVSKAGAAAVPGAKS